MLSHYYFFFNILYNIPMKYRAILLFILFFLFFFIFINHQHKIRIISIENSTTEELEKIVCIKGLNAKDIKQINIEVSGEKADTLNYNVTEATKINEKNNILKIPIKYLIAGKVSDILINITKKNNKTFRKKIRIKTDISKKLKKHIPIVEVKKSQKIKNRLYFFMLWLPLNPSHLNKEVKTFPILMDSQCNIRSFLNEQIKNKILKLQPVSENKIESFHITTERYPIFIKEKNVLFNFATNEKNTTVTDYILEINAKDNKIIKKLNLCNILDQNRLIFNDENTFVKQNFRDWLHPNSILYDNRDQSLIISSRYQGLFKIGTDGKLKWILSTHKDWKNKYKNFLLNAINEKNELLEKDIQNGLKYYKNNNYEFEWPSGQHCVTFTKDKDLLIFDNGISRDYTNQKYSRAVIYKIDEQNMTVKQVWQYGKEIQDKFFSYFHGTAYNYNTSIFINPSSIIVDLSKPALNTIKEIDINTKEVLSDFYFTFKNIKQGKNHPWFDEIYDARIVNIEDL